MRYATGRNKRLGAAVDLLNQKGLTDMVRHKGDAPGMRGYRTRNQDSELRQKRSDNHIGTIEGEYDIDLGVRSDMHLGTYLK